MEVAVSLRSRGTHQGNSSAGFAALGGDSGNHGSSGRAGSGEDEVWAVGTVRVPLPPFLSPPGTW